ncbi:MAG: carboxylating nicotinate-nucleotide diphosphorylase [Euryarchaeota archaeon]|nr:carboxylating nicotinate-nucleotide diphosphorylase [Euryarchaeota archaeon]
MDVCDIERFMAEDVGFGDITTAMLPDIDGAADLIAHEDGIVAGLHEAQSVFNYCNVTTSPLCNDGDIVNANDTVTRLSGRVRDILVAERVALNLLCRMSGIATLTQRCKLAAGSVTIAATRKTTPGFRYYEKKAVAIGGGDPHRYSLSDSYLFKDNHLNVLSIEDVLSKKTFFTKKVEIEVEAVEDCLKAAQLGADIIMFDNMETNEVISAVTALKEQGLRDSVLLEASGGITLDNIRDYASTGVDVLSLGYLTHSSAWLDFSLELHM